jgi:hypothetical protein
MPIDDAANAAGAAEVFLNRSVRGFFDGFLDVAEHFFAFAVNLFFQAFRLLFFTMDKLSCTFLDFSGDIFCRTPNLIFVHDFDLLK